MRLFDRRKLTASLCRKGTLLYIDVLAPEDTISIYMFHGLIPFISKRFCERDLRQVITLLEAQKSMLIKERNYPDSFEEMLIELKGVVDERYEELPKK